MKKALLILLVAILAGIAVWRWPKTAAVKDPLSGEPLVAASFYPLYFLASEIMDGRGSVYNITPAGAEPHDYEPATRERMILEKADLVILNGKGFEPWAKNLGELLPGQNILAAGEPFMRGNDPHVWLDPVIMAQMAEEIAARLSELDPAGASLYRQNLVNLLRQFGLMDGSFRDGLAVCEKNSIITTHDAFSYLARRYGFEQIAIAGTLPEGEPGAQTLAELTRLARAKKIKYVFFETLASPRIAETLAKEAGAQTLVLNPLEGLSEAEMAAGQNFFNEMKNNLTNLRTALVCR